MIERSSIKHDKGPLYLYYLRDDKYCIRLSSRKSDVRKVRIWYCEKYDNKLLKINGILKSVEMKKVYTTNESDIFLGVVPFKGITFSYFFELIDESNNSLYYGNFSFADKPFNDVMDMFDGVTYLLTKTSIKANKGFMGGVIYQIFVERFCPTDEVSENWYTAPIKGELRTNGTFKGITSKLDYLKELSVDAIYLTPIFVSRTAHRYDVEDYFALDPLLGTEDDFKTLVNKTHKKGIKVILDVVFNHTSANHFAFQDVIRNQSKSEYKDWYFINKYPVKIEKNANYKCFSTAAYLPKLNTDNEMVQKYLFTACKKYITEFNVDGFRIDVSDEISFDFLRKLNKLCKDLKSDFMIYGEIWFDPTLYLSGDMFDSFMNYRFYDLIRKILHKDITLDQFNGYLQDMYSRINVNAINSILNLVSSHDSERFFYQVHENYDLFKMGYAMLFLLPGATMLYYGEENALGGSTDPDNRRGMDFNRNKETFDYIKRLSEIKHIEVFKYGSFNVVYCDKDIYVI
ncbi:MAG TPA: hypothetical protein DCY93_00660, partial [Firmicutes bacterium]|nr:hypothetical protein [Bacillota bacterium]